MSPRFVLASTSESRRRILKAAGIAFEAVSPSADEEPTKRELIASKASAKKIAMALAELKGLSVSKGALDALVLGADQLLVCEGKFYSKAGNTDDAKRILRELRGRTHELVTAIVLAKSDTIIWRHVESARLTMRAFSDAVLESYLSKEGNAVLDLVGCYRIEGPGAQLFSHVEGDFFAIQGLPLLPLLEALRVQSAIAR